MSFYPPYIEGTIPAFYNDNGNKILTVPFTMNKSVGINQVWGFALRMKTIQSNQLIYTDSQFIGKNNNISEVKFDINFNKLIKPYKKLNVGQYYKIQIAYIGYDTSALADGEDPENAKGETGNYSTVGVVKYTTKPEITIQNMSQEEVNFDLGTYIGQYCTEDVTEKPYSYRFDIYDSLNNIVATSEEQLHNCENDTALDTTIDEYFISMSLQDNQKYKIVYTVTTINNIVLSSPKYSIIQQPLIPPEIEADVIASMNKDNGYMDIIVQGHIDPENNIEKNAIGTFQILRASEIGGFSDWQVIKKFALFGSPPSQVSIRDFTVEQGKQYQYALQQYNKDTGLLSNKIYSEIVLSDFEDSFLYDGKRQLKIKFNPQVSSFKQNLQEAKTVTLGQQYPFILRGGKSNYKEFPIAGMISYYMDEEHLFLSDEELGLDAVVDKIARAKSLKHNIESSNEEYFDQLTRKYGISYVEDLKKAYVDRELPESSEKLISGQQRGRTSNLLDYNIAAERIFKLKVLEFLNDGQPKLFRSPGEGNYVVRLMNTSLSPNDQVGRMLHSFSTTATEVEDFSSSSLEQLGIIASQEVDTKQRRWETILLSSLVGKTGWVKINTYTAFSLQCLDMLPGSKIRITFSDAPNTPQEIVIGVTGAYYGNLNREIQAIEIDSTILKSSLQGQITYGFYGTTFNYFDTYQKIIIDDIPLMQFVGETIDENGQRIDIKSQLTDIRNKILDFELLHFIKRDVVPVYKYSNNFYYAPKYTSSGMLIDLTDNQFAINFAQYPNTYVGKETITWAQSVPNKQICWETIYSQETNNDKKGVINIRSSVAANAVGVDVCYQTNTDLIEFKNYLEKNGYHYLKSVRIITDDIKDYDGQLSNYTKEAEVNDVIVVNGVNAYVCVKRKAEKAWNSLPYKLATIVTIEPSSNGWFRLENDDEYITEIKIRLPQLKTRENRMGYLVYETYADLSQVSLEGKVIDFDPLCLYKVINNANFTADGFNEELYYDANTQNYVAYSNKIQLDDYVIDISESQEYQVAIPKDINKVYISSGILADIGVQRRIIEYGIETKTKYSNLIKLKENWKNKNKMLNDIIFSTTLYGKQYETKLNEARNNEAVAYQKYINQLQKELDILSGQEGNAS